MPSMTLLSHMEQQFSNQISNQITPAPKGIKPVWAVILLVAVVALVGAIAWQKYSANQTADDLQKQISLLQNQALQKSNTIVATTSGETAGWKTYKNDKYGFEVKYPSDFKDIGEMSTAAWTFIEIEGRHVDNNYYGYRISIAQDETTKSLADYYSTLSNTKIEVTDSMLSGLTAVKWVVVGEPNSKRVTFIATKYKNRIYEISDDITQLPNDESLKIFDNIISTFKFTK